MHRGGVTAHLPALNTMTFSSQMPNSLSGSGVLAFYHTVPEVWYNALLPAGCSALPIPSVPARWSLLWSGCEYDVGDHPATALPLLSRLQNHPEHPTNNDGIIRGGASANLTVPGVEAPLIPQMGKICRATARRNGKSIPSMTS